MNERNILCIDLKSFFASVECVERNLDPFTTPLIVADPSRKGGAITLAVTPYMKTLGVPSRGRVFEIPKNIKYITAPPRMSLYVKKSKEVINCFLDFISKEDMHVYSIDEAFLDVTDYLKLYKMDDVTLAKTIMARIKEKTGLTSTCGIGPNLLLAKVALDIESKHSPDFIAKWTYEDVKTKLWNITPLDEMWGIGSKTMKKLNDLGIYKVGDINKYSKDFYKKRFGVLGEELYLHANGIDNSNIKDDKYEIKNKSYGLSQILYKDYTPEEAILIIKEMCETICKRLRNNKKVCGVVGFGIGYSRSVGGGFYHSKKLSESTDNENVIFSVCKSIYDSYIEEEPIRKVSISLGKITDNNYVQLNLFEEVNETINEIPIVVDEINKKFGDNAILKASSLLNYSTIKMRNKKMGGHNK
ncbi:dNA-damage repair protein [Clostridium sp. CAG:628]|nr:dNA-damage repair protein [Clostridium sp. CAG:628]